MSRNNLPKSTETEVLMAARRRCCICFGLNRDTKLKAGQIAHLDKNRNNNSLSNLAFLCLHHHDEYDSRSSQRKNFTIGEVKAFRDELHSSLSDAFTQRVYFGEMSPPAGDPFAGLWIRTNCGTNSAEITLTPLPEGNEGRGLYYLSGQAIWGTDRPFGPNLGSLEHIMVLIEDQRVIVDQRTESDTQPALLLHLQSDNRLLLEDNHDFGTYGAGVTFQGEYLRAR